jgi:hypothetical protein
MRQLTSIQVLGSGKDETADLQVNGRESLEGSLVLMGLSYLGLVCLLFYVDYRMQLRRARKRHDGQRGDCASKSENSSGKDREGRNDEHLA